MNDQEFFEEFGFMPEKQKGRKKLESVAFILKHSALNKPIPTSNTEVVKAHKETLKAIEDADQKRREVEAIKAHSQELYDKFETLGHYPQNHFDPEPTKDVWGFEKGNDDEC